MDLEHEVIVATGLVYHENYTKHLPLTNHPERPERIRAILQRLQQEGIIHELVAIVPHKADLEWIYQIHSPEYVQRASETILRGEKTLDSLDTEVSEQSFEVALLAVGGVMSAIDAVASQKVQNAFCVIRPPGHHAMRDYAMGFCIFNNVAIAARYAQKRYNLERILIVDWDVHHGNGTQEAFYEDATVFYFSIHQGRHYPGTGFEHERGRGLGTGYTLNVVMPPKATDQDYIRIFEQVLLPQAKNFRPDLVLISAGFDTHINDPLANMGMTEMGFAALTDIVCDIAEYSAEGRIVSSLEGGYHLISLAKSVEQHIQVLKNWPKK